VVLKAEVLSPNSSMSEIEIFHQPPKVASVSKRNHVSDLRLLWQCRRMPKAYRTDIVGHQKFQGEIGKSKNARRSERVRCPVGGCECSYEMYGSQSSSRDRDITTLQERLKGEHPSHTSEVLAVNAFRRVPRWRGFAVDE
jgi:hypothetical protein